MLISDYFSLQKLKATPGFCSQRKDIKDFFASLKKGGKASQKVPSYHERIESKKFIFLLTCWKYTNTFALT